VQPSARILQLIEQIEARNAELDRRQRQQELDRDLEDRLSRAVAPLRSNNPFLDPRHRSQELAANPFGPTTTRRADVPFHEFTLTSQTQAFVRLGPQLLSAANATASIPARFRGAHTARVLHIDVDFMLPTGQINVLAVFTYTRVNLTTEPASFMAARSNADHHVTRSSGNIQSWRLDLPRPITVLGSGAQDFGQIRCFIAVSGGTATAPHTTIGFVSVSLGMELEED
jgi:hypothetical protein